MKNTPFIIYQTSDGKVKIETHFEDETVWLNQKQIATLFTKGRSTITEHIGNVLKRGRWIKRRYVGISDMPLDGQDANA